MVISILFLLLGKILSDALLVLIKSIIFGNLGCKFIIKLRKLIHVNSLDGYLEQCGLAGKFLSVVFLGEGYIYIYAVTNVFPYKLLFKGINEGM